MFLAPETILEEPVGCAVDMWATGVILYLMLVGYPPFWSSSDEYLLLSILGGRYTMPSPYWDNIKTTTKELVTKLIVQQPEARLTAAQALAHPALSDSTLGRKISVEREGKRNFLAVICGIRALISTNARLVPITVMLKQYVPTPTAPIPVGVYLVTMVMDARAQISTNARLVSISVMLKQYVPTPTAPIPGSRTMKKTAKLLFEVKQIAPEIILLPYDREE
ncbi:hypothetical protein QZH41_000855 [Actinostola sp. cb2023]|nr:hypothetical protein QZH41_000855 [Actinostola sp. cb2023]